jgi:hypothetical protein
MRPLFLTILLALGSACGSEAPQPPVSVEPPEETPAAMAEASVATDYELHEWGLLDVAPGHFELAAGPGDPQPATTAATTPTQMRPPTPPVVAPPRPHPTGGRRKPVVYVHADAPVEFQLDVRTSGPVAEHWPPTTVEDQMIRWQVAAQPGACASGSYPTADSPQCANAPDGYCELADLPGYETADGACLTVNGQTWDHLFYRSGGAPPPLPIRVTAAAAGGVLIENVSLAVPQGGVYRFSRSATETIVLRIDMPAVGASATMAQGTASPGVRAELSGLLRSGGLTDDEAQAFEQAWFEELFDNGGTGGAPIVSDAIIYILPMAHLDPVSQLIAVPAPTQIKRMFWVRVAFE